jgi:hypothetical protein
MSFVVRLLSFRARFAADVVEMDVDDKSEPQRLQ